MVLGGCRSFLLLVTTTNKLEISQVKTQSLFSSAHTNQQKVNRVILQEQKTIQKVLD